MLTMSFESKNVRFCKCALVAFIISGALGLVGCAIIKPSGVFGWVRSVTLRVRAVKLSEGFIMAYKGAPAYGYGGLYFS